MTTAALTHLSFRTFGSSHPQVGWADFSIRWWDGLSWMVLFYPRLSRSLGRRKPPPLSLFDRSLLEGKGHHLIRVLQRRRGMREGREEGRPPRDESNDWQEEEEQLFF